MRNGSSTPFDVKLMNMAASVLFVCGAVGLLVAGGWWLMRQPMFSIGRIVVHGDLMHTSAGSLRANVAPRLVGNFFSLDLGAARETFEQVPWVRSARIRRDYPNGLVVDVQEHVASAYWGPDGSTKLVNNFGEIFDAESGDLDRENLPRLQGPDAQASDMLRMYQRLVPLLKPLGSAIDVLDLNNRGSWRVTLDNGAVLELGASTDLAARTNRFVRTLPRVAAQQGRRIEALESADLRHEKAYALKLRGVTTITADAAAARPAARPVATATRTPTPARTARQNN